MALNFINARTKPCILGPILPRRVQKNSFKHQLHSTHEGAVGWEPHGSFPRARATKLRGLTITWMKSTTYTD